MNDDIKALQNNPLLLAKGHIDSSPITLVQKRCLIFIYAKVLDQMKGSDIDWENITEEEVRERDLWFPLSVDEMIFNTRVGDGGNQTIQIWDQLQSLHETKVILNYKTKRGEERKRHTHLVSELDTPVVASGEFKVKLSFQILKNIQFQKGVIYRFISLRYAMALSSVVHLKLYEALSAVMNLPEWKVELDELKAILHLQNQYPQYSHFRDWVLKSAQKALTEETDLTFSFREVRGKRRKVTHIIFKVGRTKKQKQQKIKETLHEWHHPEEEQPTDKSKTILKLERMGIKNPEQFSIPDEIWEKAIKEEDKEGMKPSFVITTAQVLHKQTQQQQDEQDQKKKTDELIKSNQRWWEQHQHEYENISSTSAYLQHDKGKVIKWTENLPEALKKYKKQEGTEEPVEDQRKEPRRTQKSYLTGTSDRRKKRTDRRV